MPNKSYSIVRERNGIFRADLRVVDIRVRGKRLREPNRSARYHKIPAKRLGSSNQVLLSAYIEDVEDITYPPVDAPTTSDVNWRSEQ